MSYKVKLDIFAGPLDLLLFLIKKDKIDIYDIPIVEVTEQYLGYMGIIELLDLEVAGEYLVMAATLIHIKSKLLLPPDEEELEEEEQLDPREELVRRLLEYKKYKDAASGLREMYEDNRDKFLRKGSGEKSTIVGEDGSEYCEASLFDLITAFRKVLKTVPRDIFHKVIKDRYTVSDKIHEIYHILSRQTRVQFLKLFAQSKDKDEAITVFLAILELLKMREILVVQDYLFGEIEIMRNPELVRDMAETEEPVVESDNTAG